MKIDDAGSFSLEKESPTNTTLVLPTLAADELHVLHIEQEDTSLDAVAAVLSRHERPIIVLLPQHSQLFTHEEDFAQLKETGADIVSIVLPLERMQDAGRYASAQGFHFTSQLSNAVAVFQQRSQQNPNSPQPPLERAYAASLPLQNTGKHEFALRDDGGTQESPVTPLPETPLRDVPTDLTAQKRTKRRLFVPIISVATLLLIVTLLPLLTQTPSSLTIPQQNDAASALGSVGTLAFTNSGQVNPVSSTGLNDIITLHLNSLPFPGKGEGYFAWLVADKTQDSIAPILLGRLSLVGGKAFLSYQDRKHTDLLVTYSRLLVTEQDSAPAPNIPPIDPKTWRYQASIPDVPTPGDEKGYSLLSHMRHLLAQDPTLSQIGLQGGLDIWLYRNIGKILEWSNAARDDWGGRDVDITRREVDRIVQYLDGQVYAFRDLPPSTPWLVDPHAGRPGLIDFDTAADEQGPPSYVSHVKLHLTGMVNAPGHSAAQYELAVRIDTALTGIEKLLKHVRSDAVQLAQLSDAQFGQPHALDLLDDMQTTANNAYAGGQTDSQTGGGQQEGEVWVHAQLQSLATFPVMAASKDGP